MVIQVGLRWINTNFYSAKFKDGKGQQHYLLLTLLLLPSVEDLVASNGEKEMIANNVK